MKKRVFILVFVLLIGIVSGLEFNSQGEFVGDSSTKLVMHFNGDVVDSSGEGNNGVIKGDVNCNVAGKFGKGCSFDGNGDWIDVGNDASLDLTKDFTIAFWFKTTANDVTFLNRGYIGDYVQYQISLYDYKPTKVFFFSEGGNLLESTTKVDHDNGVWHHLAITVESNGKATIYIDGILDNIDSEFFILNQYGNLEIGRDIHEGEYFEGIIDELIVLNMALSASKVLELYKAVPSSGGPLIEPPPVCVENWDCGNWGNCLDGKQTRNCNDLNNCGTIVKKPLEVQDCGAVCVEDWDCSDWGECVNGEHVRDCEDLNNCGTDEDKPDVERGCVITGGGDILPPPVEEKPECPVVGFRESGNYCSKGLEWELQKGKELSCENDFECSSNTCKDDICVEKGLFIQFLNWLNSNIFAPVLQVFGLGSQEIVGPSDIIKPAAPDYQCNRFVDIVNGNDNNNGLTEATAWKTLAKAGNTAVAGNVVCVRAGTYTQSLIPANSGSGSGAGMIVFKAYPGEECQGNYGETKLPGSCKVIIDGQNLRGTAVNTDPRNYIRIEGFEVKNHRDEAIFLQDGDSHSVTGIEIVNNYIHDNGDLTCVFCDNPNGHAIYAANVIDSLIENNEIYKNGYSAIYFRGLGTPATRFKIRGNNIHYNWGDGLVGKGIDVLIEDNKLYNQIHTAHHQDGIDVEYLQDSVIRNNLIYDFTQLIYFVPKDNPDSPTDNVEIYGNVLYLDEYANQGNNAPGIFVDARKSFSGTSYAYNMRIHSNTCGDLNGRGCIELYNDGGNIRDILIRNNIIYRSDIDVEGQNIDSDYNIIYQGTSNAGEGSHTLYVDPQFVNANTFDFHLKSNSPAIDVGDNVASLFMNNLPSPFVDIDGNPRPDLATGLFDIGAYEFVQGGECPDGYLDADVTGDNLVDINDLTYFFTNWRDETKVSELDMTNDGVVDIFDAVFIVIRSVLCSG